jgi:hypothetical protein
MVVVSFALSGAAGAGSAAMQLSVIAAERGRKRKHLGTFMRLNVSERLQFSKSQKQ